MKDKIKDFRLLKSVLCSAVVLAWAHDDQDALEKSEALLKAQLGMGWTATTAFQFMGGKHAEAALVYLFPEEKIQLLTAHYIAKAVCFEYGVGAVNKPDQVNRAELLALVKSKQHHIPTR